VEAKTFAALAACAAALLMPAPGHGQPLTQGPYAEALPIPAVVATVRAAGFNPLSRPLLRGGVYVVFAVDRYFMDVRVLVDARSGRVLSATRLAGAAYGAPAYGAYEVVPGAPPGYLPPYGGPPRVGDRALPPEMPPGRNAGEPPPEAPPVDVAKRPTVPPKAPLPRARPDDPAAAREPPPAAAATAPPSAPAPTAAAGKPAPAMVPVAPLDSSPPPSAPPPAQASPAQASPPQASSPQATPPAPAKPVMVPVAPL
jgi:hypothetical protein